MKNNIFIPIAFLLFFVGCTSTQQIQLTVSIDGKSYSKPPIILDLGREKGYLLKINLKGYRQFSTKAKYKEPYWMFANIKFDDQITIALDITTGYLYKLIPENMSDLLEKENISPSIEKDRIYFVTVREVDESAWWRNIARLKPLSEP